MIDLSALKEPQFISIDWESQYREILSTYEKAVDRKISKGQLEAVLFAIFAYRENLLRIAIQEAAKQNLLAYARAEMLDHLGALLGVYRLPATKAVCTIRFYFEGLNQNIAIPRGTRVASQDGKVMFETTEDVNVSSGTQYVDVFT